MVDELPEEGEVGVDVGVLSPTAAVQPLQALRQLVAQLSRVWQRIGVACSAPERLPAI